MTNIKHHAYLFDATRCIDCRACMVACSVENNIEMDKTRIWVAGLGVMGEYPNLKRGTMVYHCMHCDHPDCMSACPVGAYSKAEDGPVTYNPDLCIGCRYCMNACVCTNMPHRCARIRRSRRAAQNRTRTDRRASWPLHRSRLW